MSVFMSRTISICVSDYFFTLTIPTGRFITNDFRVSPYSSTSTICIVIIVIIVIVIIVVVQSEEKQIKKKSNINININIINQHEEFTYRPISFWINYFRLNGTMVLCVDQSNCNDDHCGNSNTIELHTCYKTYWLSFFYHFYHFYYYYSRKGKGKRGKRGKGCNYRSGINKSMHFQIDFIIALHIR